MPVVVFGSINMDLVVRTYRFPKPGETLSGRTFYTAPGGKGANQAVAAARLGAVTRMVGRVGTDVFGGALLDSLKGNGVNAGLVEVDGGQPSGTALITVDDAAENTIIIVAGANGAVGAADIARLETALQPGDLLLLQLEVPLEAVTAAAQAGRAHGCTVILDPAPARELPDELLRQVSLITPNESEAAALVGFAVKSAEDAARAAQALHARGVEQVVIKMGSKGAYWSNAGRGELFPAYPVHAVDTVAAGDAFNGGLAAGLSEGLPLRQALQWGMAAGALSTTKPGAQPSMPDRAALLAMLHQGVA